MHRIAAVIPVHNRATLIGRALESVLGQRRPPDEIVVVDDGSTDGTAAAVTQFGSAVRLVRTERCGGVSAARNLAVASTDAEFVAFLDSDDYWCDDHLERMNKAIRATNAEAWLYFSDIKLPPPAEQRNWEACDFTIEGDHELRADAREWVLAPRQPMMIPTSVFKREAYVHVGGSEVGLFRRGDTHLFFKVGLEGPVCAVAGVTGVATRDDLRALTMRYPDANESYLRCTLWLYSDLLRRYPDIDPAARKELRTRLSDAHWMLARSSAAKAPADVFAHSVRSVRTHPASVVTRARRLPRVSYHACHALSLWALSFLNF